ncbi:hypothetical protein GCM10029964_110100 [Kibdelosporangium lantanae]
MVTDMWAMPAPDAPPEEFVRALRDRAKSFSALADAVGCQDESAAAVAREEACQLRCQAAVIEAMSTLYDELGLRAQRWGEFAERIRSFGYPQ